MKEPFAIAILAAGEGTRFKSRQAKVLHCAGGRPLIELTVRTARELPAGALFVIVGYQADAVIAVVKAIPGPMPGGEARFICQEGPLGTGHALRCGRAELELAAPPLPVFFRPTPRAPILRAAVRSESFDPPLSPAALAACIPVPTRTA